MTNKEKSCKYCQCSDEPDNCVIEVDGIDICEVCIRIAADMVKEMATRGDM